MKIVERGRRGGQRTRVKLRYKLELDQQSLVSSVKCRLHMCRLQWSEEGGVDSVQ